MDRVCYMVVKSGHPSKMDISIAHSRDVHKTFIHCLVTTVLGYGVKVCDICEGGMFGCGIGVQWHICRGGGVYLGVSTLSYHDLLRFAI